MIRLALSIAIALAGAALAQTTTPADEPLDYGTEGLVIPQTVMLNGHVARTAELLGDAYRRNEPLVWKRAQYVAELGQVALPEAAPYLRDAMKDQSPAVRAQAARSAAMVGVEALLADVETLLSDEDARVRREAVLAVASLARAHDQQTAGIERGLADAQPQVIAAALESAWTPQHAQQIAQQLASLPAELKTAAADALGRVKSRQQAEAVLALLDGDVAQRAAAVRAAGEMGVHATKMLDDPHPSVRREAVAAMRKLARSPEHESLAIRMLDDPDPTVRQAAAQVLTPLPSTQALAALTAQLDEPYAPLHEAVRRALIDPADANVRAATIEAAGELLSHANPRRREDASYVLGHLRSDAQIERHIELLKWDPSAPDKADWPMVAQAAESLGLIKDARAADPQMTLVKAAPQAAEKLQPPQRHHMERAMANAMLSAARLGHRPALPEAVRILQIDPELSPGELRAASVFAVGVLSENGKPPEGVNLLAIYDSAYEAIMTKFEAIKALGNLRHSASAQRLKAIAETNPTPELRWIGHWAYQRCADVTIDYTPPSERRIPPVSISDLSR